MKQKQLIKSLLLLLALMVGSSAWAEEEKFTFSQLGYSNGEDVSIVEGTNVTSTFDQGSGQNAPKYYTTGSGVRMYTGNTLEIALNDQVGNVKITAIDFTFSGTSYTG